MRGAHILLERLCSMQRHHFRVVHCVTHMSSILVTVVASAKVTAASPQYLLDLLVTTSIQFVPSYSVTTSFLAPPPELPG
jgi:hypothetical protein